MPLVSIITPLFNKEPYVGDTIRSVLAQSMADWEMIVVENGSTDGGPGIVRQFSDPRIRLVTSPKRGPGAARNFGLRLATGEWILFLDADDLLAPDYLAERLDLLKKHPSADLLAGCWIEFRDGRPDDRTVHRPATLDGDNAELETASIAYAPWILHATLIRRDRLTPGLLWPEELDGLPSEDAAFWFPVVCGAKVAWSRNAGALYRVATINSRDAVVDVERQVRATIGVIEHNLRFAESVNRGPNSRQMANIVRVLENGYRMALHRKNRPAAATALNRAQTLLKSSSSDTLSMRARHLLGLRLFNLIRFGAI